MLYRFKDSVGHDFVYDAGKSALAQRAASGQPRPGHDASEAECMKASVQERAVVEVSQTHGTTLFPVVTHCYGSHRKVKVW